MFTYYKVIDESILSDIYKFEDTLLSKFKNEYDNMCSRVSKSFGWRYVVCIHRWVDVKSKWGNHSFDGYTATLQINFTDDNDKVIEIDECICSFFENITFISFDPLRRKYMVFQNEDLADLQLEVRRFICNLERC